MVVAGNTNLLVKFQIILPMVGPHGIVLDRSYELLEGSFIVMVLLDRNFLSRAAAAFHLSHGQILTIGWE